MKAITIWQPWASLLACGAKRYETRSWATSYRGPIVIHAAKKSIVNILRDLPQKNIDIMELALSSVPGTSRYAANDLLGLPLGCVIATAELVGCHKIHARYSDNQPCIHITPFEANMQEIAITGDELLFGDWAPGRYAWEFTNMQTLSEPIPAKGKQRLWEWEGDICLPQ